MLHVVTDDAVLARADFRRLATALIEGGGPRVALHVRGVRTGGLRLCRVARSLVDAARAAGSLLVVNDRVDVALAVGADGAHLGRRSIPVGDARRVLGPDAGVGASAHTDDEVTEAAGLGADWIFAGTIYTSASHPGRDGRGPSAVASATVAARTVALSTERARVPVLAIGGVTPERVAEVRGAGAYGVAAIEGIWGDADPVDALSRYLAALEANR